jgi:thiol:disulfide interchange protein
MKLLSNRVLFSQILFKRVLLPGTVVCVAALWAAGCSPNSQPPEGNTTVSEVPSPQPTLAPVPTSQPKPNPATNASNLKAIAWESTFETALQTARLTQKPIMADFFATWCGPCHFLAERVYVADPVIKESANFVSVQVDVDKRQDLAQKYQVESLPTIVFFDPMGKEISRESGVPGDEQSAVSWLVDEMQTARTKASGTPA